MTARRHYQHRRGVTLKEFVRVARRSVIRRKRRPQFDWSVFVYYKGHDVELDQLLHKIVGGEWLGSGTWLKTMQRDVQFGFKTEKQARAAAARVPWWLRVRVTVKRSSVDG